MGREDEVRESGLCLSVYLVHVDLLCGGGSLSSELSALFEIPIPLVSWQTRHRPGCPCG